MTVRRYDPDTLGALWRAMDDRLGARVEAAHAPVVNAARVWEGLAPRLGTYGIRIPRALDAASRRGSGRGSPREVFLQIQASAEALNSVLELIYTMEREAARARKHLRLPIDQLAIRSQIGEALDDPRFLDLARLDRFVHDKGGRPPAQQADDVREWLRRHGGTPANQGWLVMNSGPAARALSASTGRPTGRAKELAGLPKDDPAAVGRFVDGLTGAELTLLAVTYPTLVGELRGMPPVLRNVANRVRLVGYREDVARALHKSRNEVRLPLRDEAGLAYRILALDELLARPSLLILSFTRPGPSVAMQFTALARDATPGPDTRFQVLAEVADATKKSSDLAVKTRAMLGELVTNENPEVRRAAAAYQDALFGDQTRRAKALELIGKGGPAFDVVVGSLQIADMVSRDGKGLAAATVLVAVPPKILAPGPWGIRPAPEPVGPL